MATGAIANQNDNHYSEEIDHLMLKMINEVREIYQLMKMNPNQISIKFTSDFIPDFVKLYDLTCDHLEASHTKETDKDKEIRETLTRTIYYLDGISACNGHTLTINKENLMNGIMLFRKYKKYLHNEGIMNVH